MLGGAAAKGVGPPQAPQIGGLTGALHAAGTALVAVQGSALGHALGVGRRKAGGRGTRAAGAAGSGREETAGTGMRGVAGGRADRCDIGWMCVHCAHR